MALQGIACPLSESANYPAEYHKVPRDRPIACDHLGWSHDLFLGKQINVFYTPFVYYWKLNWSPGEICKLVIYDLCMGTPP